jgi:hypothetical protein
VGSPLKQIQHAHDEWFANTVRLQVGVPLLRGKSKATPAWRGGGPVPALQAYLADPEHPNGMTGQLNRNHYNVDFLAYLDQAVALARQLGMTVVICAQHENLDNTAMPEGNDVAFWKIIHDHYGSAVVCDLFNEPAPHALYSNSWAGWRSGGRGSDGVTYIGFQRLVNQLRAYGLNSTFWVEGSGHASTLAGVSGTAGNHQLSDPLHRIVYSIHHPRGARTPANWMAKFGYLARLGIPVVVGEWTNYAARKPECWPDAHRTVPAFLEFVASLGVCGLIGWSLNPGVLVVDHTSWTPTQILPSYACDGSITGQGAGKLIQAQFRAWAQQAPGMAAASQGATD